MKYFEGVLKVSMKGVGYVELPGEEGKKKWLRRSAVIDPNFLNTGLNGDRVKVLLHPERPDGEQTGEIAAIIARAKLEYVGVVETENGFFFLVADDERLYKDILLANDKLLGAKAGDKVLARISKWDDPKKEPIGEVLEVIGKPGEHEVEMRAIVLDRGFRPPFAEAVEAEATALKASATEDIIIEAKTRRDCRTLPTFTIDPADAKDFDDAISLQEIEKGKWEVGIHIADVAHFMKPGSKLDEEARHRATSIYLVDRTIPMLPEVLSNDLCSLRPDEDKLTFSAIFTLDEQGKIYDRWFGRTIIRSKRRFTYEEAQEIIEADKGEYHQELKILNQLAKKLRNERFAAGAIAFEKAEIKFVLDPNGKPTGVQRKVRKDTHLLVEDFMLLANKEVAIFVSNLVHGATGQFVYRVHDLPDSDRLEQLASFVRPLGYQMRLQDGRISSHDFNQFLESTRAKPEEYLIQTAAMRAMAKAIYSMNNIGHYGLAFPYYTHFTSPIRRYPDVMVHRLLDLYLRGVAPSRELLADYHELSLHSSLRETEAADAERESVKYKQVEYLESGVGKTFRATISGVAKWGLYVEELASGAEGLVRLAELKDDFYLIEEEGIAIIGKNTRKRYRLGDQVEVKLIKADLKRRQLDFVFV